MRIYLRLYLMLFLFGAAGGCASDRALQEEERARLENQRHYIQRELDQHPVGTKWATHSDSMELMRAREGIDGSIQSIDRQQR